MAISLKRRIYYFLMNHCGFQLKTLQLLNTENLYKLSMEYGFKK